eukprot:7093683-Alexandrium_andersonii.AAC.1
MFADRLQFAKRGLGLEKHRALAQEAASDALVSMGAGTLTPEAASEENPNLQQLDAAFASLPRY